jgi:hypothetical protein
MFIKTHAKVRYYVDFENLREVLINNLYLF